MRQIQTVVISTTVASGVSSQTVYLKFAPEYFIISNYSMMDGAAASPGIVYCKDLTSDPLFVGMVENAVRVDNIINVQHVFTGNSQLNKLNFEIKTSAFADHAAVDYLSMTIQFFGPEK